MSCLHGTLRRCRKRIPCETRTVPPTESSGCGSWRVPLAEPPDSADLRAAPDHADEALWVEVAFVAAGRRLTGWRP